MRYKKPETKQMQQRRAAAETLNGAKSAIILLLHNGMLAACLLTAFIYFLPCIAIIANKNLSDIYAG